MGNALAASFLCLVSVLHGAAPSRSATFSADQDIQEINIAPKQHKDVEVQVGEDDPYRFHTIEIYGGRKNGCVFASVAAAIELAKHRGEQVIVVKEEKINRLRDDFVNVLENLAKISQKYILSIDFNEEGNPIIQRSSFDLGSLNENEQILLRQFFRALGADELANIQMKGLEIDENDFEKGKKVIEENMRDGIRLAFSGSPSDKERLKEISQWYENPSCDKEGLVFALTQLEAIMADLCRSAKTKESSETYCAQEWYKFVKKEISDIKDKEGLSFRCRVVLGMLQDPDEEDGMLFCDRYTLNDYQEISNKAETGPYRENPVSGNVYIKLIDNHRLFYKKGCPKIELNVLSCKVGVSEIIEGEERWNLVGHMMPLVRREDNCMILYQTEKGDAAAQSFPVIVKSEETPDESNTDEKGKYMDTILLQMKIGALGFPRCEKFSIMDVYKDRVSALKKATTFERVFKQLERSSAVMERFLLKYDELEHLKQSDEQAIKALKEENERLKEENKSLRVENESLKEVSKSPK
ncbi:MAG: hypothetical protein K2L24_02405 [Opitutales bacterium]|nr:hypothetical protein [Opitutales bacterium]